MGTSESWGSKQTHRAMHYPGIRGLYNSSWCLAEGYYRNGYQRRPMGPCGSGRTLPFYGDVYSCFVWLRQRTKMLVIPVENSDLSAHLLNRLHFDFHSQSRLLNTHTLLYLQCSLSGLGNSRPSFCSAIQNFGCGFEMPRNLLLLR